LKRDDDRGGTTWLGEIAAGLSRRLPPASLLLVLALLILPGLAVALPRPLPPSPAQEACPIAHIHLMVSYYCDVEFSLSAGNGYRITVSGEVGPTRNRSAPDDVTLSASKGDATVNYLGHGKLTATHMTASFGRFGRFSLRFRPSGRVRHVKVPKTCVKDRPPVVTARLGTYIGTIRFRGERGYTRIVAHRASGGLGDLLAIKPKLQCQEVSPGAQRREAHTVHLRAEAKTAHGAIAFEAWAGPAFPFTSTGSAAARDPYTFLAFAFEKARGTEIIRTVAAPGPTADFVFDSGLSSATLTPPAPFSSSGSFQRNADGAVEWTGSLAVSFPGVPQVPLFGPSFETSLTNEVTIGNSK
jgi:hypothetical protein